MRKLWWGGPQKSKSAPGTQDYQIEEYSSFNKCNKPLVKMVPNALLYMRHISSQYYTLMFAIQKHERVCGFPIITATDLKTYLKPQCWHSSKLWSTDDAGAGGACIGWGSINGTLARDFLVLASINFLYPIFPLPNILESSVKVLMLLFAK